MAVVALLAMTLGACGGSGSNDTLRFDVHTANTLYASGDFDKDQLGPPRSALQVLDGIRSYQFAPVDDHHLLAGLLNFGKDVGAENDRVVAGEALDQIASLIDLLGVKTGGGFVEDQNVWVVNNRLSQSDALAVAFRQPAEKLVPYIRDSTAFADIVNSPPQLTTGKTLELADKGQIFRRVHFGIEWRSLRQVADALLDFQRLLQNVKSRDRGTARARRQETRQHPHGCSFARSVWPEKADDLAFLDLEGDVIHRNITGILLRKLCDFNHRNSLQVTRKNG